MDDTTPRLSFQVFQVPTREYPTISIEFHIISIYIYIYITLYYPQIPTVDTSKSSNTAVCTILSIVILSVRQFFHTSSARGYMNMMYMAGRSIGVATVDS